MSICGISLVSRNNDVELRKRLKAQEIKQEPFPAGFSGNKNSYAKIGKHH